ncbi:MAG: hypothetical protein HY820_23585 [Acidobacteria bacterium]|nr:hypothetical protein [Acidobacteriota bacterium]
MTRNPRIEHIEAYSKLPADAPETMVIYGGELVLKTMLPVFSTVVLMVKGYDPGSAACEKEASAPSTVSR